MTRDDTIKLLLILRTIWPEIKADDPTITGWEWAFEGVPYALAELAAKRYIRTGTFPPKPAELLKLISVQQVAPGLLPEAAWSEVMEQVQRCGYNRPPVFHDGRFLHAPQRQFSSPLIARAVDSIGWAEICTSEKPEIVRAQFIKALTAVMGRAVTRVQTGDAPALAAGVAALPEGGARWSPKP